MARISGAANPVASPATRPTITKDQVSKAFTVERPPSGRAIALVNCGKKRVVSSPPWSSAKMKLGSVLAVLKAVEAVPSARMMAIISAFRTIPSTREASEPAAIAIEEPPMPPALVSESLTAHSLPEQQVR